MLSKCKKLLWIFILMSMLTTIVTLFPATHVTHYTNLSEIQVQSQEDRWIQAQVQACQQVGGTWQAGWSTAGCNVPYEQPNTAWYISPQENPAYEWWQTLEGLVIVVSTILVMLVIALVYSLWDKPRQH